MSVNYLNHQYLFKPHAELLFAGINPLAPSPQADFPDPADNPAIPNSAIKYPVTVGLDITRPERIVTRDISYVVACVKSGWFEGRDLRALIHTIRGIPNSEMAKGMKASLPYFLGSLCSKRRSNANVLLAHFMLFDLDHVPDIEAAKATAIQKLPWVRYAFRSVRDGVKLIAALDKPLRREEDYRALWPYLALQVEKALGLKPDSTPDWSRACFFSFDPGLLHSSGFQPLDTRLALKEAELVLEICQPRIHQNRGTEEQRENGTLESNPPRWSRARNEHGLQQDPSTMTDKDPGVHAGRKQNLDTKQGTHQISPLDSRVTAESAKPPESPSLCDSVLEIDPFEKARMTILKLAKLRIAYTDWVKIGMALYAGFGDRGRELWDLFLDNPNYEDSPRRLGAHWRSFKSVHSITLDTLFWIGGKYGCD